MPNVSQQEALSLPSIGPLTPVTQSNPLQLPPLPALTLDNIGNFDPLFNSSISGDLGLPGNVGGISNSSGLGTAPATGSNSSLLGSLIGIVGNAPAAAITGNPAAGTSGNSLFGLSIGRIAAFALGLILIAGGIYLFGRAPITEAVGSAARAGLAV